MPTSYPFRLRSEYAELLSRIANETAASSRNIVIVTGDTFSSKGSIIAASSHRLVVVRHRFHFRPGTFAMQITSMRKCKKDVDGDKTLMRLAHHGVSVLFPNPEYYLTPLDGWAEIGWYEGDLIYSFAPLCIKLDYVPRGLPRCKIYYSYPSYRFVAEDFDLLIVALKLAFEPETHSSDSMCAAKKIVAGLLGQSVSERKSVASARNLVKAREAKSATEIGEATREKMRNAQRMRREQEAIERKVRFEG